ncbi:MAG: hypothetical protein R2748_17910 [Bryobacterales bacterium]
MKRDLGEDGAGRLCAEVIAPVERPTHRLLAQLDRADHGARIDNNIPGVVKGQLQRDVAFHAGDQRRRSSAGKGAASLWAE